MDTVASITLAKYRALPVVNPDAAFLENRTIADGIYRLAADERALLRYETSCDKEGYMTVMRVNGRSATFAFMSLDP